MDIEALQADAGAWHRKQNYYLGSEVHTSSERMIEAYLAVSEDIFVH